MKDLKRVKGKKSLAKRKRMALNLFWRGIKIQNANKSKNAQIKSLKKEAESYKSESSTFLKVNVYLIDKIKNLEKEYKNCLNKALCYHFDALN
jgi:hypothetical protein